MKKVVVGYLFYDRGFGEDERAFVEVAKKKKINLEMINLDHNLSEDDIKKIAKKCSIFYCNSGDTFTAEIIKHLELLGKKVIDSSRQFYYDEDKWMFFLKCQKHEIPTPRTILLSEDIPIAKAEIREFGCWPIVLKRIEGTMAEYVDKAENLREAEKVIRSFWKKGSERLPIIAQEFIHSKNYRVTIVGNKIVQTAMKQSNRWKTIGNCAENFKKFPVDKELKKIINNLIKTFGLKVCGIDLMKKDKKWIVLEINSSPAFDFFPNKRKYLVDKILDFLVKDARKH